jgi:hypothetical protein
MGVQLTWNFFYKLSRLHQQILKYILKASGGTAILFKFFVKSDKGAVLLSIKKHKI